MSLKFYRHANGLNSIFPEKIPEGYVFIIEPDSETIFTSRMVPVQQYLSSHETRKDTDV